jgi:hypothetical protein
LDEAGEGEAMEREGVISGIWLMGGEKKEVVAVVRVAVGGGGLPG